MQSYWWVWFSRIERKYENFPLYSRYIVHEINSILNNTAPTKILQRHTQSFYIVVWHLALKRGVFHNKAVMGPP